MLDRKDMTARLRAAIEEELGASRRFADLTSVELEAMAARLVKAIAPMLDLDEPAREAQAA